MEKSHSSDTYLAEGVVPIFGGFIVSDNSQSYFIKKGCPTRISVAKTYVFKHGHVNV